MSQLTKRSRATGGIFARAIIIETENPVVTGMMEESKGFATGARELRAKITKLKEGARTAKGTDKAADIQANAEADKAAENYQSSAPPCPAATIVERLAEAEVGWVNGQTFEAWATAMVGDPPAPWGRCLLATWRKSCRRGSTC
ncbi:unnamed protein product [Prorocentrum cordatum]|uniref:Uncharacterized protein n=1 Tax=Prorocentrum cordatum TaxID=2364126 RepID=A0ABN9SKJ4_9DINO|nr:unnamed protein product [Polarella glacialis]